MGSDQLGRWFDAYSPALALYARQFLPDDAASDVVQEVFLGLLGQSHPPRDVKAWLFRAARNAALNARRAGKRRSGHEQRAAAGRSEWFETRVDDLIDARLARSALEALPPEQREIVVLRIWAQLTLREIAGITGQPVSTAAHGYGVALAALRERMDKPCRKNT